jgi:hypothetical protein
MATSLWKATPLVTLPMAPGSPYSVIKTMALLMAVTWLPVLGAPGCLQDQIATVSINIVSYTASPTLASALTMSNARLYWSV